MGTDVAGNDKKKCREGDQGRDKLKGKIHDDSVIMMFVRRAKDSRGEQIFSIAVPLYKSNKILVQLSKSEL
jgi:hypothetical protein